MSDDFAERAFIVFLCGIGLAILVGIGLFLAHVWIDSSTKRDCRSRNGAVIETKDGEWRCEMPAPAEARP